MTEVHIDTSGMDDVEKITAMITEMVKYFPKRRKKRAREIREENRRFERERRKMSGFRN